MKIAYAELRALHERNDRADLPVDLVPRIRRILLRLQEATSPGSAAAPGFRVQRLKGNRISCWSVHVSGTWRVAFRFAHGEVVDVQLINYR